MTDQSLRDRRILVLEDEYMLSEDMRELLESEGAVVLSPAARLEDGIALLNQEGPVHGAVLDVNLQGKMVFPLADRLTESGIPFLFTTGYDPEAIPPRFDEVVRCEKPVDVDKVRHAIGQALNRC